MSPRAPAEWMNPINPFNWIKVIWHKDNLIASVIGKPLPPIQADTNPTNKCNYRCIWCNSKEFQDRYPESLSRDQLFYLADLYRDWGIKATCVAGGGEPLLNAETPAFIRKCRDNGVQVGVITNGSYMTQDAVETIARYTKWVGISLDAGTKDTYCNLKGASPQQWYDVLNNVTRIAKYGGPTRIAVKYLIHPSNQHEIFHACELAKQIGARDFQIRPVGWDNLYEGWVNEQLVYDINKVNEQIEKCFELSEPGKFEIYGVRGKFNPDFTRSNNFKKCYCTVLLATFCADGYCYLCFDRRGRERLCKHEEIRDFWGSEAHLAMIAKIDPQTCPRCTYGPHNQFVEQAIINDGMCINFP